MTTSATPRKPARWLPALLALTVIFLILSSIFQLPDASTRLDAFPLRGAAYASRDVPADPAELPVIGQARLVKRLCQTPTQRVLVTIIDGTRNRHAVHDPAYCLRGAGWEITGSRVLPVPGGEAACLSVAREGRITQALYWFTDGQSRHSSLCRHLLQTAARRLTLGCSGPAHLFVLIASPDGQPVDWERLRIEMPELWQL